MIRTWSRNQTGHNQIDKIMSGLYCKVWIWSKEIDFISKLSKIDWKSQNYLTFSIYIDIFYLLINKFDLLINNFWSNFDFKIKITSKLSQKEMEITSKSCLLTWSLTCNQICIVIDDQIWMAWNPNRWQFDLGSLIA